MEVTCYIVWQPGHLEFRAYRGAFVGGTPAAEQLIHSAVFSGEDIPTPGNETFRFNFWLNDDMTDHAPSNGLPAEVVVTAFSWADAPTPW